MKIPPSEFSDERSLTQQLMLVRYGKEAKEASGPCKDGGWHGRGHREGDPCCCSLLSHTTVLLSGRSEVSHEDGRTRVPRVGRMESCLDCVLKKEVNASN